MKRATAITILSGFLLAACQGEPGPVGPAGPEGPAGPPGPAGAAGTTLRIVESGGEASCDAGEVMISAICPGVGTRAAHNLVMMTDNSASCVGHAVRIACAAQ
jgi:hypothetical protein